MFCNYISYKCFINNAVLSRKWNSENIDKKDKIYKSHQKECWTDFFWGAVFMVEGLNGGGVSSTFQVIVFLVLSVVSNIF